MLQELSRLEESEFCFKKAIEIKPNYEYDYKKYTLIIVNTMNTAVIIRFTVISKMVAHTTRIIQIIINQLTIRNITALIMITMSTTTITSY